MQSESNSKTPLRVFLCHSSSDKAAVRILYKKLQADGFEPWLDEEDIYPGEKWEVEIPRAVRNSHVVIVCLSTGSTNKAGYIQKEIKFALDQADEQPDDTIFIIPLRLEECSVPERLSTWQWVNYFDDNGYKRLKRSLDRRAQSLEMISNSTNVEKTDQDIKPDETGDVPLEDSSGQPDLILSGNFADPPQITLEPENITAHAIKKAVPEIPKSSLVLVMKGGGVKGLAYVGALKVLEKYYHFDWFAGTSASAIAAVLLAAGYSTDELEKILSSKNFLDFLDSKWKAPFNLVFKRGLFEDLTFKNWIEKLLREKIPGTGPVPLSELPKRVTIYAPQRDRKASIFDSLDPKTRETSASFAVRCSMSIPFIFTPAHSDGTHVFDGGMQNNYPVNKLLQTNPGTKFIGLYLGNYYYEGISKEPSLFGKMLQIRAEWVDVNTLEKYEKDTVVIDPRPISTIDFNLTALEKSFLLNAGNAAALRFLFNRDLPNGPAKSDVEYAENQVRILKGQIEVKRKRRKIFWRLAGVFLILAAISGYFFLQRSGGTSIANTNTNSANVTNSNRSTPTPIPVPVGMALVTGGKFLMGRDDGTIVDEKPAHNVSVDSFFMDIYEVTNEQYGEFAKATGYPTNRAKFPAVNVDWEHANQFCKNIGKRLPTEEEWEFAARGTSSLLYPWGNEWKDGQANAETGSFAAVGTSKGVSPFGIYDMIGNAGEWTASDFKAYPNGKLTDVYAGKTNLKTIRGGSFGGNRNFATTAYRIGWRATGAETYNITGFRCVKDIDK